MIDLLPDAQQQAIADGIVSFLSDVMPLERLRAGGGGAGDRERWRDLAGLGCFGLSLSEAGGGVGLGLAEQALAFREYGRFMLPPSVLATVVAAHLAERAGADRLRDDLAAGVRRAGIVNPLKDGVVQLVDIEGDDLGLLVDGRGARLFEGAALADRSPVNGLDRTVGLAHARIAGDALAEEAGERLPLMAALLAAAMLCGNQHASRDMAASYAVTREQFGRKIGVFQGVKHLCADMGLWGEAAWSQTVYAALSMQTGAADTPFQVIDAKMVAGEAAIGAARGNIQVHGGMGFTAEVDAHLLLKRAHLLHQLFGDPRSAPRRLLDLPLAC